MEHYDVIVIGAGPAGYVAAIRCAQLGKKTAIVDSWINDSNKQSLGGTCLNVGCVPSKALLESSELYLQSRSQLQEHGISCNSVSLDLDVVMSRKLKIVSELTSGISTLMKSNNIKVYNGVASVHKNNEINIKLITTQNNTSSKTKKVRLQATNIILAPGSVASELQSVAINNNTIVNSSAALSFTTVPKTLAIIGAGVIGLELGSVWQRYGSQVKIFEYMDNLLPMLDSDISQTAATLLRSQGINFSFSSEVIGVDVKTNQVELFYKKDKQQYTEEFDKIIVATGRVANTKILRDSDLGLKFDAKGFIEVDTQCHTNIKNIYAIGDAVRGPMLAHKGSQEGNMVAEIIAGNFGKVNYETIPAVIYTNPEIAWCGLTEQECREKNIKYKKGSFRFAANARAKAYSQTDGQIKVLADFNTDQILGVQMVGKNVSEIINQAVLAMEFKASSEDLALTLFAHPSLSEVLHEAALDVNGLAIHKKN